MQSFSSLLVLVKIKGLLQSMYAYFFQSIKNQLEHGKLVKILQTKGLKILCNVKTWWIGMLAPSKCVLAKYNSLIVKMVDDMVGNICIYQEQLWIVMWLWGISMLK